MGSFKNLGAAALLQLLHGSVAHTAVTSTGFTVELGDVSYFLPPKAVATLDVTSYKHLFGTGSFAPITVVQCTECHQDDISSAAANFSESDDVFQDGFLESTFKMVLSRQI